MWLAETCRCKRVWWNAASSPENAWWQQKKSVCSFILRVFSIAETFATCRDENHDGHSLQEKTDWKYVTCFPVCSWGVCIVFSNIVVHTHTHTHRHRHRHTSYYTIFEWAELSSCFKIHERVWLFPLSLTHAHLFTQNNKRTCTWPTSVWLSKYVGSQDNSR